MRMRSGAMLATFGLAVTACTFVHFTPAGTGLALPPRPDDCRVEFFRTKQPDKPYDELGTMQVDGGGGLDRLQEALRKKACQLGADAVIVTRGYQPKVEFMAGTAVKYRDGDAAFADGADDGSGPAKCWAVGTFGRWSVCQIPGKAIYLRFGPDGEPTARFTEGSRDGWSLREDGKTWRIRQHPCVLENGGSGTCPALEKRPLDEQWSPVTEVVPPHPVPPLAKGQKRTLERDGATLELSESKVRVSLPDGEQIDFLAESPKILVRPTPAWMHQLNVQPAVAPIMQ